MVVAVLVVIARWVSGDLDPIVGPAAATAVVVFFVTRAARRLARQASRREARQRQRDRVARGRLEHLVTQANRGLFDQLQALDAVRDTMHGAIALPQTRGWAASPDLLREIAGTVIRERPRVVVETGSGASTIAIAACLHRNGSGHLWSLEHLPDHAAAARQALATHGLTEWVTIVDAPLVDMRLAAGEWPWYDTSAFTPDGPIDLLLVDGPPAATAAMARYPALPVLGSRLAQGAVVILDDVIRSDEREMVVTWQRERPGLQARYLPLEKGAYVLVMGPDVTGSAT